MRNVHKVMQAAAAGLLLAGCATPPKVARQPDPVAAALSRAIAQQDHAAPFTRTADGKAPPARLVEPNGNITVSYRGEAGALMSRVAAARGMAFRIEGPLPRLPLYVAVDVRQVTLTALCRDVGMQFGQRADLVLSPSAIVIRYRGQP